MTDRAKALAARIQQGAAELVAFADTLTADQWRTVVPRDGRSVGTIIHHVGYQYPIEMGVVRAALVGAPITDVTWGVVDQINADHAKANPAPTKGEALTLIVSNSAAAADEVRSLTDADLATAVPFSLSFGAPMTVQFVIEDHPVRHPWHHIARIKEALGL